MQPTSSVCASLPEGVHQSRWGYHPCDYQTSLLVRRLFKAYMQAVYGLAAWRRWARKAPHNRVVRRWHRDAAGKKTGGYEVVGLQPEPLLCPVFVERGQVTTDKHGGHVRDSADIRWWPANTVVPTARLESHGIECARAAIHPVADPRNVRPLGLTVEQMQEMLARLERKPTDLES